MRIAENPRVSQYFRIGHADWSLYVLASGLDTTDGTYQKCSATVGHSLTFEGILQLR